MDTRDIREERRGIYEEDDRGRKSSDRERDPLNLRTQRLSKEELEDLERTGYKLFIGNLSYDVSVQEV